MGVGTLLPVEAIVTGTTPKFVGDIAAVEIVVTGTSDQYRRSAAGSKMGVDGGDASGRKTSSSRLRPPVPAATGLRLPPHARQKAPAISKGSTRK